jgi:hypothetical protein
MTNNQRTVTIKDLESMPTRIIKSLPLDMYFKRMTRYEAALTYGEGVLLLSHLAAEPCAFVVRNVRSESIDKALVSFVIVENVEVSCDE